MIGPEFVPSWRAAEARGAVVVVDVLRAFTTAADRRWCAPRTAQPAKSVTTPAGGLDRLNVRASARYPDNDLGGRSRAVRLRGCLPARRVIRGWREWLPLRSGLHCSEGVYPSLGEAGR